MPQSSWYTAQIKDEGKAAKMYRKKGYPSLAKDEARHRKFLLKERKSFARAN